MPVYEYFCPKCEIEFEVMRPFSKADEAGMCPRCGSKGEKLMSLFASKVEDKYIKPKSEIRVPEKPAFRKRAVEHLPFWS